VKLREILGIADRNYPEGMILAHWNARARRPHARTRGDRLAHFIVSELHSTYAPDLTDAVQLHEAACALKRAMEELDAVRDALESASFDKCLADWCARADREAKSSA